MLTSTRRGISYPNTDRSDRPDVPLHISNLIPYLDADAIYTHGTESARLAAAHFSGGGRFWWATDSHIIYYDDGSAWWPINPVPAISVYTFPPATASTSSLTAVISQVIPGGTLGTNGRLRITVDGDYLNNSGGGRATTVEVKYGGTILWKDTAPNTVASALRFPVNMKFDVFAVTDAAHQGLSGSVTFAQNTPEAPTTGIGNLHGISTPWEFFSSVGAGPPINVDSTVDKTLTVSVSVGATVGSLDYTMRSGMIEVLRPG